MPDLVPRPGALDEAKPVAARPGVHRLGGEDLDRVAVVERALQRHQAAVDPGPDGAVAHLGVNRVGEVHRGGALRKRDDLAARGEDVHLGGTEVEPERLKELGGVGSLPLPVDQLPEPGQVRVAGAEHGLFLVLPVRGDSVLSSPVHAPGPDLQLDRLALRADHRRVQRLVHVELGHRDVVLEPPRDRIPPGVHGAEHRVAVPQRVDEDADADQVVNIVEADIPGNHLLVHGVVVLGPPGYPRLDLGLAQVRRYVLDDLLQEHVAPRGALGDQPGDLVVALREHRGEGQVLKLPLDGVHAQPVRERREDLQYLA